MLKIYNKMSKLENLFLICPPTGQLYLNCTQPETDIGGCTHILRRP